MSTATGERRLRLAATRSLLYSLPTGELFELPGRPHVVYQLRSYSNTGNTEEAVLAARNDAPFLFKAFETGQIGPKRLARMHGDKPRVATIHEYLDWTVTAQAAEGDDELDFGGFRVLVILPRYRSGWPPPGEEAPAVEQPRKPPVLGPSLAPLPALQTHGRPVTAATIRSGPGYLEVPFVATHENKRGRGYCRCLVEAIEEVARSLGLKKLMLCSTNDTAVQSTWRHLGFEYCSDEQMEEWDVLHTDLVYLQNTTQMHKDVPPPRRYKPVVIKHEGFKQRSYALVGRHHHVGRKRLLRPGTAAGGSAPPASRQRLCSKQRSESTSRDESQSATARDAPTASAAQTDGVLLCGGGTGAPSLFPTEHSVSMRSAGGPAGIALATASTAGRSGVESEQLPLLAPHALGVRDESIAGGGPPTPQPADGGALRTAHALAADDAERREARLGLPLLPGDATRPAAFVPGLDADPQTPGAVAQQLGRGPTLLQAPWPGGGLGGMQPGLSTTLGSGSQQALPMSGAAVFAPQLTLNGPAVPSPVERLQGRGVGAQLPIGALEPVSRRTPQHQPTLLQGSQLTLQPGPRHSPLAGAQHQSPQRQGHLFPQRQAGQPYGQLQPSLGLGGQLQGSPSITHLQPGQPFGQLQPSLQLGGQLQGSPSVPQLQPGQPFGQLQSGPALGGQLQALPQVPQLQSGQPFSPLQPAPSLGGQRQSSPQVPQLHPGQPYGLLLPGGQLGGQLQGSPQVPQLQPGQPYGPLQASPQVPILQPGQPYGQQQGSPQVPQLQLGQAYGQLQQGQHVNQLQPGQPFVPLQPGPERQLHGSPQVPHLQLGQPYGQLHSAQQRSQLHAGAQLGQLQASPQMGPLQPQQQLRPLQASPKLVDPLQPLPQLITVHSGQQQHFAPLQPGQQCSPPRPGVQHNALVGARQGVQLGVRAGQQIGGGLPFPEQLTVLDSERRPLFGAPPGQFPGG